MNIAPYASLIVAILICIACVGTIVFALTRIRKLMETSKRRKSTLMYPHEPDFERPPATLRTVRAPADAPEPTDQCANEPMKFLRRSERAEDFPDNKTGG